MGLFKRYGTFGVIYMVYCLVRTKFVFPKAKIIRFPIDIRNKANMSINKGFTTGKNCRIEVQDMPGADKNRQALVIGKNVQLNDFCHITAALSVYIEDHVLIASNVYISDVSHGSYGDRKIQSNPDSIPHDRPLVVKPVRIEQYAWLGDGVCVLPGVKIGRGAIIGANAVVTKEIPPYCIAVGIPAKPIKKYNFKTAKWEKI